MGVTAVIPTTLSRSNLGCALDSVIKSASLAGPNAEVLVVVNGAQAAGETLRVDSPLVRVVKLDRASAPGARNAGIDVASNDAIVFTDDDCTVPETWCTDMAQALGGEGHAAIAAPVRTAVTGAVTAFINHQRIFDAPAIDADQVRYLITANCGYRRDLAPPGFRFDDVNFNNAAEDADFGYRLRDNHMTIHWLGSASPVVHILGDSVSEITERFIRYGRANARLHLRRGRWRESVPDGLEWYREIASGEYVDYRRFCEFVNAKVREIFALYDLMLTTSFLIGYFEEMGAHLGHVLMDVDHESRLTNWQALADRHSHAEIDWSRLTIDVRGMEKPTRQHNRELLAVAAVLRQHVRPATNIPARVAADLAAWKEDFEREIAAVNQRLFRAWDVARSRPSIDLAVLDSIARSAGSTFNDGCHDIEKMMYSRNTGHEQAHTLSDRNLP
jgi:glycosyltransferase involved in cell wall biosynthesis